MRTVDVAGSHDTSEPVDSWVVVSWEGVSRYFDASSADVIVIVSETPDDAVGEYVGDSSGPASGSITRPGACSDHKVSRSATGPY